MAKVFFVQSDIDSVPLFNELLNLLRTNHIEHGNEKSTICIGKEHIHPGTLTISQHFINIYRKYRLFKNDRELVLNYEDYLVSVQLCMAEINKQKIGDYDVEVSSVMEMSKKITKYKLAQISASDGTQLSEDGEFQEFLESYKRFLKSCNVVDTLDVFQKLIDSYDTKEDLKKELENTNYVFLSSPSNYVEVEMTKFLSKEKPLQLVQIEYPLDEDSICGNTELHVTQSQSLNDLCSDSNLSKTLSQRSSSATEMYIEQIFNGYLQLIVNSRCEIALARVLNVPERGLDHVAFTDLKHAAKQSGLSLYQTAVSYVMRIRLGGRSYKPDSKNVLGPHGKGLSEFTDVVHKIQTIIEEDPNHRLAVKRVINLIKNTILKHRDNVFRRQSIENVAEKLQNSAVSTIDMVDRAVDESPKREIGCGGSMLGRKCIKVIRSMLDNAAGINNSIRNVDILTDVVSSQKTPLRFPSILSKFKSPLEVEESPDCQFRKSLAERMKEERFSKKQKVLNQVPRYKACMDWALSDHYDDKKPEDNLTLFECLPSKSLAQCGSKTSTAKRILESANDQENVTLLEVTDNIQTEPVSPVKSSIKTVNKQDSHVVKKANGKRMLESSQLQSKPAKKAKTDAKASKNKKKNIPLQKGQKQLTAFFRL